MYINGKFISQAIGDHAISFGMSEATAIESSKSTALMRCCKDLGIGSDLWDPYFIQQWKDQHSEKVWCLNEKSNEKRMLWRRKDRSFIQYPWVEQGVVRARSPVAAKEPPAAYAQVAPSLPPVARAPQENAVPPPPMFVPPPPAMNVSPPVPVFTPPPPPQFAPPPPQPVPTKVFKIPTDIKVDGTQEVPSTIVAGSPFEGQTWDQVVNDTEGRNFLSRACGRPALDTESRALIADALRRHLQTKKVQQPQ